jgi:hypothetical protein
MRKSAIEKHTAFTPGHHIDPRGRKKFTIGIDWYYGGQRPTSKQVSYMGRTASSG